MVQIRIYHQRVTAKGLAAGLRFTRGVLREIETSAKILARGGPYSTGELSNSIEIDGPVIIGKRIHGSVGTDNEHAAVVERGARIHEIFPRSAPHIYRFGPPQRPMLSFIWHGRLVFFHQIPGGPGTVGRSHPGMRGKRYLTRALKGVAFRRRLRFVVYEKP